MATVTGTPTGIGTTGWTNPTNAYADDANKASCPIAVKNTEINGIWTTFGITDPGGGATITKVEIGTQHYLSTITSIIATMGREISWNAGAGWGTDFPMAEVTCEVTSETATIWVDVTQAHSWTWAELSNTNLQVRIACQQGNDATGFTMYLDVIYVRVTYTAPCEAYAAEAILAYNAPCEAYATEAILAYSVFAEAYATEAILDYAPSTLPCEVYCAEAILDYEFPPCEVYAAEAILAYVGLAEVYATEAILNYEPPPCEAYAAEAILNYVAPAEVYATEAILSYEPPPCEAYAAEAILDYEVSPLNPCEAYAAEAVLDYTPNVPCEAYAAEVVLDYEVFVGEPCEAYAAEVILDYNIWTGENEWSAYPFSGSLSMRAARMRSVHLRKGIRWYHH